LFYPEKLARTKWFEYYCSHFSTVELNVTFYRTMKPAFFENLYCKSPDRFLFSVKAPRTVTHYRKFTDVQELLVPFYETVRDGLKDKLGCVLFQLPPGCSYSEELLMKIMENVDPSFGNVIEFRHESWWREDVYSILGEKKICFCTVSYPRLPDHAVINTSFAYCRFHGVPKLYYSRYDDLFLQQVASQLSGINRPEKAYIYFDNTAEGAAIGNAKELYYLMEQNGWR